MRDLNRIIANRGNDINMDEKERSDKKEQNRVIQSLLIIALLLLIAVLGEKLFGVPESEFYIIFQKIIYLLLSVFFSGAMLVYVPKKYIRIFLLVISIFLIWQFIAG